MPDARMVEAAGKGGIEAHSRLRLARQLRDAAQHLGDIDLPDEADTVRKIALKLDRQRRAIMAKSGIVSV